MQVSKCLHHLSKPGAVSVTSFLLCFQEGGRKEEERGREKGEQGRGKGHLVGKWRGHKEEIRLELNVIPLCVTPMT